MNFFLFAAENAEEAPGGLNGLFENNLINWFVLVAAILWLWYKYTPDMFAARKARIDAVLLDAAKAKQEGESFLKEQQAKVANAETEAATILAEAKKLAEELKLQMAEQTKKDVEELTVKIENQLANERQLAVTELRATAAKASVKLAEQVLPGMMTPTVKANLLNQFMEQLDSATFQRSTVSSELFDAKSGRR